MVRQSTFQLTYNLQKGFRGGVSVYGAMGVSMVTSFALSVILVRLLSQEEFGIYKLITSTILVGTYVCSFGLESTFLRFAAEFISAGYRQRLKKLIKWFMGIRFIAVLLFVSAVLIFQKTISSIFNFPPQLTILLPVIGLILLLQSINSLWGTAFLSARMDQVSDSINNVTVSLLRLLGFATILWMGYGISGVVEVWSSVLFFSTIYYSFLNYRWFKKGWVNHTNEKDGVSIAPFRKRISRFAFFNFFAINVKIFKDISIDMFVIVHFLGAKEVALYGLTSTLVVFVGKLNPASMLRGVLIPIFVGRYTDSGDSGELIKANTLLLKVIILSTLPAYLLTILLGEKIIALIYSPEYLGAYTSLIFLCSFFFFIGLTYPFNPLLNTLEKNELFFITGIFSIYNLIADIILIPRYGINGAAIATGSAGFLQFFFYWAAVRWYVKLKIRFPWRALLKTLENVTPMVVLCLILRPSIITVASLIGVGCFSVLIYLVLTYFNNIFDEEEISLFKRAMGRRA